MSIAELKRGKRTLAPHRKVVRSDPEMLQSLQGVHQLDRIARVELLAVLEHFAMRKQNAAVWTARSGVAARPEEAEDEALTRAVKGLLQRHARRRSAEG